MPSLSVRLDSVTLAKLNRRLGELLHQATNLEPVMAQAAEYMKRSTVHRIERSKTSPSGERWAALSELTIALKGHSNQLFHSGEMSRGIDIQDVSDDGFMITSSAPYSSFMQKGVKKVKGKYKSNKPSPQIPARPFMGYSEENVRRISKMLREHITKGGDS